MAHAAKCTERATAALNLAHTIDEHFVRWVRGLEASKRLGSSGVPRAVSLWYSGSLVEIIVEIILEWLILE